MDLLGKLSLAGLAHRCQKETTSYQRERSGDPQFCFELFRLALKEHNEQAWTYLAEIYTPQISRWIHLHPDFQYCNEEAQVFVNGVFSRLWLSLSGSKFENYAHLGALIVYLKRCVHSEIIDFLRTKKIQQLISLEEVEEEIEFQPIFEPLSIRETLQEVDNTFLWHWLQTQLKDEAEKIVVYATFFLALQPRDILETYPKVFATIDDIYRIKENVILRLRRASELDTFLSA